MQKHNSSVTRYKFLSAQTYLMIWHRLQRQNFRVTRYEFFVSYDLFDDLVQTIQKHNSSVTRYESVCSDLIWYRLSTSMTVVLPGLNLCLHRLLWWLCTNYTPSHHVYRSLTISFMFSMQKTSIALIIRSYTVTKNSDITHL